MKTDVELSRMSTKNLLAYYRAERKRNYIAYAKLVCDCCGEFYHEMSNNLKEKTQGEQALYENNEHSEYLNHLKELLSQREHVKK